MTELETLRAEVQQLRSDNRAMQQFVYVASHDLQAPVRSVRGFLQLLERRYGETLDEDAREFISMALASSEQMQSLIAKLLQWSRLDTRAGEPVAIDFVALVKRQLDAIGAQDRLGRDIQLELDGSADTVMMDVGHATQLVDHLLENSCNFVAPDREPQFRLRSDRTADGRARFVLADNGRGVPDEYLEKVFQPFFRGAVEPGENSGSGLGLALCQRILDIYGGECGIHSDGNGGTAVEWILPIQAKDSV